MESYLQKRRDGRYVVIVPFVREVTKGKEAIRAYNERTGKREEKPLLELRRSRIIHYGQIEDIKEALGLYKHKK